MKIEVKNDELYILDVIDVEIYNDGRKFTYNKRKHHNVDGPSSDFNDGDEYWRFKGNLHRKYGPAIRWRTKNRWWFEGVKYTQEEFMEKFL